MSYSTWNVTGKNGYTIYNIQAKTKQQAKAEYYDETGEKAMKAEKA